MNGDVNRDSPDKSPRLDLRELTEQKLQDTEMIALPRDQRLLLLMGLALASFAGFSAFKAVPDFKEVFKSFGNDLPVLTRLALNYSAAFLSLPLCVLAVWALWPRREKRGRAALITGAGILLVAPMLVVLIMYLPIIQLGNKP